MMQFFAKLGNGNPYPIAVSFVDAAADLVHSLLGPLARCVFILLILAVSGVA